MQATVIVRVPPNELLKALPAAGDDQEQRTALNGEAVRVVALDDCAQIDIDRSLTEEPLLLFARVGQLVGAELLAKHDDERGIPAFPASYSLSATTWDAAVEELGEAAEWIPIELGGAGEMPDLSGLAAMLGPEGAALAAQLQGPEGAELMQSAMQMAQQLMGGGNLGGLLGGMDVDALRQQAEAMSRDPSAGLTPGQPGQPPAGLEQLLGGMDIGALQGQAEAMLRDNPHLQAQLENMMPGVEAAAAAEPDETDPGSDSDDASDDDAPSAEPDDA